LFGVDELDEMLNRFKLGTPPFLISSAFPYTCLDSTEFFFFPFPQPFIREKIEPRAWKMLKGIKFVELNVLKGGKLNWIKFLDEDVFSKKDEFLLRREDAEKLKGKLPVFEVRRVVRNRLDRVTKSSMLFHLMETFFKNDSGLFFLFEDFKGYFNKIWSAMRLLEDEGIGADRSQGKGVFNLTVKDFTLPSSRDANIFVTLSLYFPLKEELREYFNGEKILSYSLVERGGFVYSSLAKKPVRKSPKRLFSEGSIFPLLDREWYGKIVKVREKDENLPHDVFLYGYAFPFKLCVESEV